MTPVTDRRFFDNGRPGSTRVRRRLLLPIPVLLVAAACAEPAPLPARGGAEALGAGEGVYILPGVEERPFWLQVPSAVDDGAPLPLLIGLHDNNARPEVFRSLTCPDGQTGHDGSASRPSPNARASCW